MESTGNAALLDCLPSPARHVAVASGSTFDLTNRRNLLQFYQFYAKRRQELYDKHEGRRALHPVHQKPRFVIPPTGYRPPADVVAAIQKIDSKFEIIFDPLTVVRGTPPQFGCHLYRAQPNYYPGGIDELILEFSLQVVIEDQWTKGKPREPGLWLVEAIQMRDRAREFGTGDEDRDTTLLVNRKVEQQMEFYNRRDQADAEIAREIYEQFIDPMWNRGRVQQGYGGRITKIHPEVLL